MCLARWIQNMLSSLQPKDSTPLPWPVVATIFLCMFGNAVTAQMLFAFLPDMVKSFGIPDEDAGYYVGLLASSMFVGRFFSCYIWGWVCDKIGRRKVLLWCLMLMSFTTFAFGFSSSIVMAFAMRLLTGIMSGVQGTSKAVLAEICDDTNLALGMSMVITSWNSGLVFGPAIGGYLARPAEKYALFKDVQFFKDYPYILPCLVNVMFLLLGFLLTFIELPETLSNLKKDKGTPSSLSEDQAMPNEIVIKSETSMNHVSNRGSVGSSKKDNKSMSSNNMELDNQQRLFYSGSVSFLPELNDPMYMSVTEVDKIEYTLSSEEKPVARGFCGEILRSIGDSKLFYLCRNRNVRYTIGLYMMFSFSSIAEHEIFSVWTASGRKLGGLDFDTNDLGFTLMLIGAGTALASCVAFSALSKFFGPLKTQFLSHFVVIFFIAILPTANILYERETELKVMVIIISFFIRTAQGCCFAGQFIFIGNCVSSNYRATVHGLSMSMSSVARALAPTIAGSIFSWSVTSGFGFPFNEKCVFIFLSFVTWLSLIIACCLNPDIEKLRDI